MTPDINFESMFFNPFSTRNVLEIMITILMLIFTMTFLCLTHKFLCQISLKQILRIFSVFQLNVRNINKNFEAFSEFYSKTNHIFSVICFSETWASEKNINKNSTFQLKNYNVIHQVRNPQRKSVMYIYS